MANLNNKSSIELFLQMAMESACSAENVNPLNCMFDWYHGRALAFNLCAEHLMAMEGVL